MNGRRFHCVAVLIGLMDDDVICLKFTSSLVYTKFFSKLCHLLAVLTRFSFVSSCLKLGSSFFLKFTRLYFETEAWGPGGEIGYSHVIRTRAIPLVDILS